MAKTGLEVLVELVEQVRLLNKKLDVLDQNVKVLMNAQRQAPTIETIPVHKPQVQQVQPTPPKQQIVNPNDPSRFKPKSSVPGVPVSGRVVQLFEGKSIAVSDCQVLVYDDQDQLVKQTKTNKGGAWACMLKPGKYVAEITGKLKDQSTLVQNKTFELLEGQKLCEVI